MNLQRGDHLHHSQSQRGFLSGKCPGQKARQELAIRGQTSLVRLTLRIIHWVLQPFELWIEPLGFRPPQVFFQCFSFSHHRENVFCIEIFQRAEERLQRPCALDFPLFWIRGGDRGRSAGEGPGGRPRPPLGTHWKPVFGVSRRAGQATGSRRSAVLRYGARVCRWVRTGFRRLQLRRSFGWAFVAGIEQNQLRSPDLSQILCHLREHLWIFVINDELHELMFGEFEKCLFETWPGNDYGLLWSSAEVSPGAAACLSCAAPVRTQRSYAAQGVDLKT